ncbi:MAG: ChaN family lipoprotein [Gemmatimonadaceae bacterium]
MTTPVNPDPGIRVVTSAGAASSIDEVARQTAQYDVVFFGEEHTDPATHQAEFELLQAIGRTGRPVVLSLEMFERDVQEQLDAYLRGGMTESDFLAQSRPWARYATDYRALVELAKARSWPVVAANVPRPLASAVGRRGMVALDSLSASERAHAAAEIDCPDDDYRRRFFEEMKGHNSGGAAPAPSDTLPTAVAQRFYYAQCVKDETMAESIVAARRRARPGAIVVHYDGSFHSDFAEGTAARVRRRDTAARVLVITAIPVPDPLTATVVAPSRANVTIFTKAVADSAAKR